MAGPATASLPSFFRRGARRVKAANTRRIHGEAACSRKGNAWRMVAVAVAMGGATVTLRQMKLWRMAARSKVYCPVHIAYILHFGA